MAQQMDLIFYQMTNLYIGRNWKHFQMTRDVTEILKLILGRI